MFLDRATAISLPQLLPRALGHRIRYSAPLRFRYFSASHWGLRLLSVFQILGLMTGEEADYTFEEVLDSEGRLVILRALEMDSLPICEAAKARLFRRNPVVSKFAYHFDAQRLQLYLQKTLDEEIRHTLVHINVASWLDRQQEAAMSGATVLSVGRSLWFRYLQNYSADHGVELRSYRTMFRLPNVPVGRATELAWSMGIRLIRRFSTRGNTKPAQASQIPRCEKPTAKPPFTVAAPYWGRGVTLDQSKSSDLFWVPFSGLAPDQVLVVAARPDTPLDESRYSYLRQSSMRGLAITNAAKGGVSVPTWPARSDMRQMAVEVCRFWKLLLSSMAANLFSRGVNSWVRHNLLKFTWSYLYWHWFFASQNVKIQVDHVDWPKGRLAADQAIGDLGGLSVSFQRTYEGYSTMFRASSVDVHFAFSGAWADSERQSRSLVKQYVSNGYAHDYAYPHVKARSAELRQGLKKNGAKFIICLLDENSVPDKRTGPSHAMRAENYRFILEKVLEDPTLGLVMKPKKPSDLRQRLGVVANLLDAALATNRCHIYEGGVIATDALPSEASLVSDVTIGLMYGSTAALESALAGSRTLLVDRESVTFHPLYALGEGQVVFRHWEHLWKSLSAFREDPTSMPDFGNWSPLLGTLDSFRDSKAGQRMGEYIGWLAQGLGEGMTKEESLQSARRRYAELWGEDKIIDIRNKDGAQDWIT